jgi:hypothetical protein
VEPAPPSYRSRVAGMIHVIPKAETQSTPGPRTAYKPPYLLRPVKGMYSYIKRYPRL